MNTDRQSQHLKRWAITASAVLVAAHIVPGIQFDDYLALAVASLILGLLNTFIKPILTIVSLPFVILSFGVFLLVINGFLLYLVGSLMKTFSVDSFKSAFFGALIISLVSAVLNLVFGIKRATRPRRPEGGQPTGNDSTGDNGPVIDV